MFLLDILFYRMSVIGDLSSRIWQIRPRTYTERQAVSTDYVRRRMEIDVNSVVLATRVYAALRERFFIGNALRNSGRRTAVKCWPPSAAPSLVIWKNKSGQAKEDLHASSVWRSQK